MHAGVGDEFGGAEGGVGDESGVESQLAEDGGAGLRKLREAAGIESRDAATIPTPTALFALFALFATAGSSRRPSGSAPAPGKP